MGNEQHGERIAGLEARVKIIEEAQKTIFAKLDEQTKQIYRALGALGAVIVVAELVIAIFKK